MRTLYLVSKRLPRVCMGGSCLDFPYLRMYGSAPRVHGWFLVAGFMLGIILVCPACAWVVPQADFGLSPLKRLPRVCMGGS